MLYPLQHDIRSDKFAPVFVPRPTQRVLLILMSMTLSFGLCSEAFASRHRSSYYHRRAAAIAQAQRSQMIRALKSQVSAANQVLKTAESQSAATSADVAALMRNLDGIRRDMESAHNDIHEAAKELRLVEADILDDQPADSDFAKAEQEQAEANAALVHLADSYAPEASEKELTTWSDLLEKLPKPKLDAIKADPEFGKLIENLRASESQLAAVRKKVFESDAKWIAAKKALDKASRHSRSEIPNPRPDAVKVQTEKQELRQLQIVVENARALVAQGELRLHQLGVSTGHTNSTRSK